MRRFTSGALALLMVALVATPAAPQIRRAHEIDWPMQNIRPLAQPSPWVADAAPVRTSQVNTGAHRSNFGPVFAASSVGSLLGLFTGIAIGLEFWEDGGGNDEYAGALLGAAFGSSTGAVMGGGLFSDNWGRMFLGSMTGMVVGTLLGVTVGESGASGWMGVATYSLTQGLFTTIIGLSGDGGS